jgi:selenocysteine lyase/cysteine desulfurase
LSGPDGEVVLVPSDFPSVTYPWLAAQARSGMRIRWVPDVADENLTQSVVDAISERTTVVCVSAVQFSTGTRVDVAALVARARDAGARVVVDVTQMAGAVPVTMRAWGADAVVCSGYKWLSAPGGVALLAVSEDLAARIPAVVGWKGSATPFEFTPQELSLARDARRFELSTMSYSAASGLLASITLLTGIGLTAIREHADRLADSLVQRVAPLGWTPYRPLSDQSASGHILSLRHPTAAVEEVQAALADEHRIITSARVGGIRVSLHVYNNDDDVRALSEALGSIGRDRT